MVRPRVVSRWLLPLLCLVIHGMDPCASINDEGRVLWMFRERVQHDPYDALSNWVLEEDAADPCDWFGVHCENGNVVALNLKDLLLKGTLGPELGMLIHLRSLVLRNNSFYGTIPLELGLCMNLELLDLENNDFSGPIPFSLWNLMPSDFWHQLRVGMHTEPSDVRKQSELKVDASTPFTDDRFTARDYRIATGRRFLRGGTNNNTKRHVPSPAPSPSPPVTKGSKNDTKPHVPSLAPSPKEEGRKNTTSLLPPPPSPVSVSSIPTQSPAPARPVSSPPSLRSNDSMPKSNFDSSVPSPVTPNRNSSSGSHVPPTVPSQSPLSGSSKSSKNQLSVYMAGAGSLVFLAFLAICFHFYRVKKVVTVKPWTTGLSGQLQKAFVTGVPQLKRTELETACEDFSNIIGSLSNCILYKGTLSSGVEIAVASTLVTSAKKWSKHSETQFRNKIAISSKVNHKNFVNLLGYCEEEEPFTRMMVFEYAPNGTLFEHLHVKEAEGLDWAARLRIVMGIAYCLEHMHQLNPPVILGNLRSSAILLTDDLAAKISDLDFSSETTTTKLASNNSGLLSEEAPCPQGVIYDFGILLLEIITGRLPYSEEDGLLSDWASDYLKGSTQLRDITDPTLKTLRDGDLRAICEVIHHCCNPDPTERPTALEVSARLRATTDVTPVSAVPRSSALWWAELEILSTEAN